MKVTNVGIGELNVAEYNPRIIKEKEFKHIKKSLKKFGFVEPIVVNKRKERFNVIVGGHQRINVAKELGITEVPVFYVDLDIEEERELNIRLNKNMGKFDYDVLANNFDLDDLFDWGFEDWELGVHNELLEIPDDVKNFEDDDEDKWTKQELVEKGIYAKFELLMRMDNKKELIRVLNQIKEKENFKKLEQCLMYLVKGAK